MSNDVESWGRPPKPKGSIPRWVWLIGVIAVVWVGGSLGHSVAKPAPRPAYPYVPSPAPLGTLAPGSSYYGGYQSPPASSYYGGYENPAPGNDGSSDCPPGGGPVYVGSNDPSNFDGDGDGVGCE